MLHRLKRHPFPVVARFRHTLVLTYAYPAGLLSPLLPPGLELDTWEDFGFLAIALVQTEGLRPVALPRILGRDFFLSGYRIFARLTTGEGRRFRGLRILRSDTNRRVMAWSGNLLTHYDYQLSRASMIEEGDELTVRVRTPSGVADLDVRADLAGRPASLPESSPFPNLGVARRFAGPLPDTFDYEPETHSILRIRGVRRDWKPQPIAVEVERATFLERPPFDREPARLANAFHLSDVDYRWERGVLHPLAPRHPREAA